MKIAVLLFALSVARCQDTGITQEERWASELAVYHSTDWLAWAQKMPIDAELPWMPTGKVWMERIEPSVEDNFYLPVRLASQTAPVSPYLFSVKFSPITTISLGRRKNAILTNVRVCNTDSRPIVLPQEQLLMASTDLAVLTPTQATWLLTNKRDMQWAVMFERLGTLGLGLGAGFAGVPYVATAIPLLQQIIDYAKTRQPDITPFLAEMLPLEIPLSAAGTKGDCATGSLFAAKKGNTL